MPGAEATYQVAIAGGGPVGLFLGCCLESRGISCIVLERRASTITHSRSIGIHPVSLELFESIDFADNMIQEGTKVQEGMAFIGTEHIGTLSFASCPPPYRFILTLPQYRTEELLEARLKEMNPTTLKRNAEVTDINEKSSLVRLSIRESGKQQEISAQYLVGCDGKNSLIRHQASIPFHETSYGDTYIMGDFTDNTRWGNKAAIFLCNEGLIESFPLVNNMRRWVVKTDRYIGKPKRQDLEKHITRRIKHDLRGTKNVMLSSFGVQKAWTQTMVKKRVVLAGDAAHVVSPIGGQGMNLGWMDAWELASCFETIFKDGSNPKNVLRHYSNRQLKIAHKAIRRAEFNMALGRKTSNPIFRKATLTLLLKTPLSKIMARAFTMRGLHSWPT